MKVLITGAAGFVGQKLAKALLDDESGSYDLVLTDIIEPPIPQAKSTKARAVKADLVGESSSVVDSSLDAAFLFHGIMSSGSEADFDLGTHPLP